MAAYTLRAAVNSLFYASSGWAEVFWAWTPELHEGAVLGVDCDAHSTWTCIICMAPGVSGWTESVARFLHPLGQTVAILRPRGTFQVSQPFSWAPKAGQVYCGFIFCMITWLSKPKSDASFASQKSFPVTVSVWFRHLSNFHSCWSVIPYRGGS